MINWLSGIYAEDTWQLPEKLRANFGLRWDWLSGFTDNNQIDPTLNLTYLLRFDLTLHTGVAQYMQVPLFQGIFFGNPDRVRRNHGFAGTGSSNPKTEDDFEVDTGRFFTSTNILRSLRTPSMNIQNAT
jgi:outer membrane receptor protein involved in Fe transport